MAMADLRLEMIAERKNRFVSLASQVVIAFSLVLYLVVLHLYLKKAWVKSDESHMYALSFGLVPFLSCFVFGCLFVGRPNSEQTVFGFRVNLFFCGNGAWVIYFLRLVTAGEFTRAHLLGWVTGQVVLNFILFIVVGQLKRVGPILEKLGAFLAVTVAALLPPAFLAMILVGSTEDMQAHFAEETVGFLDLGYEDFFRISLALFVGFALSSLFVYAPGRRQWLRWIFRVGLEILGIGAVAWIVALVAITPNPDVQTMNAHLGPAGFVLGHGVPLVDVFCQYGMLSYLVFDLLFLFVPPSYMGGAFLVGFLNAVYLIVMLLVLRRVLRNNLLAYGTVFLAGAAFVALAFNSIPAVGAMRFLPPLVVLLSIVWLRPGRLFSFFSIAAMVLCSLWSIEALLWSLVSYLSFIAAEYLVVRRSFGGVARVTLQMAAIYLVPHGVYSLLVRIFFGAFPSYKFYLDEVFNLFGGASGGWTFAMDFHVLIWVIAPLTYVSVYACSAWYISRLDDPDQLDPRVFTRALIPAAILGGLELSYWVGRSLIFHFWPVVLPLLIVLAIIVDRLLPKDWKTTLNLPAISCLASVAVLYSGAMAWALEYGRFDVSEDQVQGNLAIAFSPIGTADIRDPRIRQSVDLVRKWGGKSNELLILMPGSVAAATLLYTGKAHRLHISNSHNDPASVLLAQRAIDRAGTVVVEGDFFFIHEDFNQQLNGRSDYPPDPDHAYSNLDLSILIKLKERWRMAIVERTSLGFMALRLVAKEKWQPTDGPEYQVGWLPKP
jgi:hypothetical protein